MLKYRSKMAILSYGSASILLLALGYLIGSSGLASSNHCVEIPCNRTLTTSATMPQLHEPQSNQNMDEKYRYFQNKKVEQAENAFETTMKSCLGTFCFDDLVKTTAGKEVARVGILVPDASEGEIIFKMLVAAGLPVGDKIELLFGSNVPPYGYGKNHGWSRIIRIAKDVIPQALRLLTRSNNSSLIAVEQLIDPQVRQLMRWHCRLSHVAAHTSMLTVHSEEFLAHPTTELEKMLTFIGYKASRENLLSAIQVHLPDLAGQWDDAAAAMEFQRILAEKGGSLEGILEKAANAVGKEMAETKSLTQWPCRSFRDYKDKTVPEQLPLKVHALAADCSAPYVKCSVRFDTAEYKRISTGVRV